MTQRDHTRSCPSCERELSGREHFGEGGLTVIWKCVCGWGSARTVPTSLGSGLDSRASSEGTPELGIRKSSGVRERPVPEREAKSEQGSPASTAGTQAVKPAAGTRIKTRTSDG
jgi:hypothetical protein